MADTHYAIEPILNNKFKIYLVSHLDQNGVFLAFMYKSIGEQLTLYSEHTYFRYKVTPLSQHKAMLNTPCIIVSPQEKVGEFLLTSI